MHATLWVDDSRQAWLTLYADGTRTWHPAVGSMPLTPDREIPDAMPAAARVHVDGDGVLGAEPVVTFEGLRFSTAGPLVHPRDEPAYGVGPALALSGRYRVRPGYLLPNAKQVAMLFGLSLSGQLLANFLGLRAFLLWLLLLLLVAIAVWALLVRRRGQRIRRDILASAHRTRARAVSWHAAPQRSDKALPILLSLFALDAAAGSAPIGTIRLATMLDPPIGYGAEVVVLGDVRLGGRVIVEHGDRSLPVSELRTDIAPARVYQAAVPSPSPAVARPAE